jgi:predicted PurR-regulated permease PerM
MTSSTIENGAADTSRSKPQSRQSSPNLPLIKDPEQFANLGNTLTMVAQASVIGIFLLLFGAFLDVGRTLLLPILSAVAIGTMLGPVAAFSARWGVPQWLFSLVAVILVLGALNVLIVVAAGPLANWVAHTPDVAATLKDKLAVFDRPLAALQHLQTTLLGPLGQENAGIKFDISAGTVLTPLLSFMTPALGELLLFLATLFFFLLSRDGQRRFLIFLANDKAARLRTLRILNEVEHNLAHYIGIVTLINLGVGTIVAGMLYLLGFSSPMLGGLLAFALNYLPYVGPAVMTVFLFVASLVTFPSLLQALVAPMLFVVLTTIEGHFVTPSIIGRQLTVNPFTVFVALAFWTWLWGPVGAFLAMPLLICGLVVVHHVFPDDDVALPG